MLFQIKYEGYRGKRIHCATVNEHKRVGITTHRSTINSDHIQISLILSPLYYCCVLSLLFRKIITYDWIYEKKMKNNVHIYFTRAQTIVVNYFLFSITCYD